MEADGNHFLADFLQACYRGSIQQRGVTVRPPKHTKDEWNDSRAASLGQFAPLCAEWCLLISTGHDAFHEPKDFFCLSCLLSHSGIGPNLTGVRTQVASHPPARAKSQRQGLGLDHCEMWTLDRGLWAQWSPETVSC